MAGETLPCPRCGHPLPCADGPDGGDAMVRCAGCGHEMEARVASSSTAGPHEPKLQLKVQAGASRQTRACPECSLELPGDAVFCTHCGYDWRAGRKLRVHLSPLPRFWWAVPAGSLLLAVALIAGGFALRAHDRRTRDLARRERRAADEARHALLVEERLRQLQQRLNDSHPLYQPGQSALLRRQDGVEHEGRFVGLENGHVLLEADWGRLALPLAELDEESRIRCDPEFRAVFLQEFLRRRFRPPARRNAPQDG